MASEEFVKEIEKRDPVLAEEFRQAGVRPKHRPVWPQNHLKPTRTATDEEAQLLDEKASF